MHFLGIVQWNSIRRDHPGTLEGYPGRVLSEMELASCIAYALGHPKTIGVSA